jgi:hypothetical protein
MITKGMVVQFLENHKWAGSLGIVTEVKECGDDIRYMVAVPIPQQGTAYIFSMESELQMIGFATLVPKEEENED